MLLVLLSGVLAAHADGGFKTVLINLNTGRTVGIILSDNVSASFASENMMINDNGSLVILKKNEIKSFEFSRSTTLEQLSADPNQIAGAITNGVLDIAALPQGADVAIYSVSGKQLQRVHASGGTFDLRSMGEHVIILNVDGTSLKISVD